MSRYYDTQKDKTYIIDPDACKHLYSEFWCFSPKLRKDHPDASPEIGYDCGRQCPYYEPEPPDYDGLEIYGTDKGAKAMARFNDFTRKEQRIILEAMEWAQTEFYDPGHTAEDRDTLRRLIDEGNAAAAGSTPQDAQHAADSRESTRAGKYTAMQERPTERRTEPYRRGQNDRRAASGLIDPSRGTRARLPLAEPYQRVQGFRGFLYIKCDHCGGTHAFCAKQPMTAYRCEKCGGWTPLSDENMVRLRMTCKCGAWSSYMTNIFDQRMDIPCFQCGAPVAVEWSDKLHGYQTMNSEPRKNRKGKK